MRDSASTLQTLILAESSMASPWPDAPHLSALQLSDPFREPLTASPGVASSTLVGTIPTVPPVVASPAVTTRSTLPTATRPCPGCGLIPVANSVYCARCGHHLSETSTDGVKIRSLEAEVESLRSLHLEEAGIVMWWHVIKI